MINALHLLWIVPLAATLGFFWGALLAENSNKNNRWPDKPTTKNRGA